MDGLFRSPLPLNLLNALDGSKRNGQPVGLTASLTGVSRELRGGRVFAALANDPSVSARMHRLPRLEVNVDLSPRLLSARCTRHADVKGRLTHLPYTTFSRFKKVREVAQQNRVRDSYPHGRRASCYGYRHERLLAR